MAKKYEETVLKEEMKLPVSIKKKSTSLVIKDFHIKATFTHNFSPARKLKKPIGCFSNKLQGQKQPPTSGGTEIWSVLSDGSFRYVLNIFLRCV